MMPSITTNFDCELRRAAASLYPAHAKLAEYERLIAQAIALHNAIEQRIDEIERMPNTRRRGNKFVRLSREEIAGRNEYIMRLVHLQNYAFRRWMRRIDLKHANVGDEPAKE